MMFTLVISLPNSFFRALSAWVLNIGVFLTKEFGNEIINSLNITYEFEEKT